MSLDSFCLWEFLLPRVPHLLRFPFRHLHEILLLGRCHPHWVLHLDSELLLDLQGHCSAIPVSPLLTLFLKMLIGRSHLVGFFRLFLPVQVEIGSRQTGISSFFSCSSSNSQDEFSLPAQSCRLLKRLKPPSAFDVAITCRFGSSCVELFHRLRRVPPLLQERIRVATNTDNINQILFQETRDQETSRRRVTTHQR